MTWTKLSPDGKYASFQKAYEYSSDTMVLVSAVGPKKVLFETPGVYPNTLKYSKKGHLFMSGPTTARLLKLPQLEPIIWTNISKAWFLEREQRIVIFQSGSLRIYDDNAKLTEEISEVVRAEINDERLFFTQRKDDLYVVSEWNEKASKILYTSMQKNVDVIFCDDEAVFLQERGEGNAPARILFVKSADIAPAVFSAKDDYPFNNVMMVTKAGADQYFLRLAASTFPETKSSVDIWYSNDRDLQKKFLNNIVLKYILWKPMTGEVTELDAATYPRHVPIGNLRYLLAFDPTLKQNYIRQRITYEMYRYDTVEGKYEKLGQTGIYGYVDQGGNYLLSHDNSSWVLYNIGTKERKTVEAHSEATPYFDEKAGRILFAGPGNLTEYEIGTGTIRQTVLSKGDRAELLNAYSAIVKMENRFNISTYDGTQPVLIKVSNSTTSQQVLGIYHQKKLKMLFRNGSDYIAVGSFTPNLSKILYSKSNYNIPPQLIVHHNGQEKMIFQSNGKDRGAKAIKMEKISYQNSRGEALTGLLYFPSGFDSKKKYPMVVGIYEMMRNQSNRYLKDGFSGRVEGMNIRYYLDRGYFIYLPDIVYDERGPGWSALDCVEHSLDALKTITAVDLDKVGLMGHSHGGYETNFIATQSKRFAAYVGGAGNSDLVRSYHSFNYNFISPFYWQFEEQQYRMFKPFAADKNLYTDNSPVYHAENVASPILLWTGTEDKNIAWDQTMEFYLALRRNEKKVITLFYRNEGHSFGNKANREDLFVKIAEWFDYHLKGEKHSWIDQMYS